MNKLNSVLLEGELLEIEDVIIKGQKAIKAALSSTKVKATVIILSTSKQKKLTIINGTKVRAIGRLENNPEVIVMVEHLEICPNIAIKHKED